MWPGKASLNIQTHGQYHAFKTQHIGSEKTYGPKTHLRPETRLVTSRFSRLCARACDAKIVRSRDAQCNTKELS